MAKSPNQPGKGTGRKTLSIPDGVELRSFEGGRPESEAEQRVRLRTEFLTFLIKDLFAYLVAFGLILAAGVYCFWVLIRRDEFDEDRRWAMSVLTSLLTALIGFAFGKTMK